MVNIAAQFALVRELSLADLQLPLEVVTSEIHKYRGSQFDPNVADASLALLEQEGEAFIHKKQKFDIYDFLEG